MTTRSTASSSTLRLSAIFLAAAVSLLLTTQVCSAAYYGKLIGKLSEFHHGVSGEVYAVDGRTLFIKDFTYDGEAPAAYFYVGTSKNPNGEGIRIRDERGSVDKLKRYRKRDITLTLPDGKTLGNIKWFSVWCDEFAVNFGDVRIPRGFDYPKPQKLAALNGVHGVSSELIVVVDAQTLLIPSFSYDGEAPDAKFWVGAGASPSSQGIRVPDENGKVTPLRRYDRKTIVLTLPGDLTIHQIGHFGVWCEAFTVDFGHVKIPQGLNVPPSLKMLGVSPQSKLNCEVLEDKLAFEVRWAVAGDSIVAQLVGKLEAGQYMAFGLSADPQKSVMVGGDVVVAWVDKQTLQGYAVDYFLDAKSQCSGGRGSCPDTRIQENTNSIRLLNAALVDGYSIVTYQRPLRTNDELDREILTNGSQAIIWAIGPLNERQEVSFHTNYLKSDRLIDFGRPPVWNCPVPDNEHSQMFVDSDEKPSDNQESIATTKRPQRAPATPAPASKADAWEIPPIQCYEPEDGVFYAQMGPTGGKHGYPAITGHVGWGISWYINGLLIPVINVVRGNKYTFVVEGGENPDTPARYHPFYITDDPIGGYEHKTPEEKAKVKIFAGAQKQRGVYRPTSVGRLCNWVPDQNQPPADEFASFGAYQRTLTLECDHGEPGIIEWTPDKNTPDTVYYQCFTHRYLGWKINVLDECEESESSASENHEVYASPMDGDLEGSSSIRVSSKVTPTAEYLQQHLHHPHGEQGFRYSHHATTNPGKLSSSSYASLLTTIPNNNNYVRLKSSYNEEQSYHPRPFHVSPNGGQIRLRETPGYRLTEDRLQQNHDDYRHRDYHRHYQQHSPLIYREQTNGGNVRQSLPYPSRIRSTEIDDGILRQSSNQQLSKLVPDYPRPMNHGTDDGYHPVNGNAQTMYNARPVSHHYANNYNHLYRRHPVPSYPSHRYPSYQPEQRAQLIVKRPVLTRRPTSQQQSTSQPRPVFMERKKSVYRPSTSLYPRKTVEKMAISNENVQGPKSKKIDGKQRIKMETKASSSELSNGKVSSMKPARNTGFDPGSIVIEGGFKPIIKNIEQAPSIAEKRISVEIEQKHLSRFNGSSYRSALDNFEPVFIPSPAVPTVDTIKKSKKKISNGKSRSSETMDDMEMAADRINAYYLPPSSPSDTSNEPPSSSSEVLITFDGKRLKDSGLARSITEIEHRSKNKLSSDVLSRTPQFGTFKGDLPASLSEDSPIQRSPLIDLSVPELRSTKNTKLTLVERPKRSYNDFSENRTQTEVKNRQGHGKSALAGTGQTILVNFWYILLGVVLFHAIL